MPEKVYGKSESSRRDAIQKSKELKQSGISAKVQYGSSGEYVVTWHPRKRKKK